MEPPAIVPVTWRDLGDVAAIQHESFRPSLAYKRWMLAFFHIMPGVKFWVSTHNGVVTGSMIADVNRGNTRILNIAVHPDHRGQGVGTALMRTAIEAWPTQKVVLMVEEHNTAAQRLYTQLGFDRSGYHAAYYGQGRPGIEMTLTR